MKLGLEQTENEDNRELLTFTLGNEELGVDILKVQEILGCEAVTTIADAPESIEGVFNLRGIIVPIVDMRIKFKLEKIRYNGTTVVSIRDIANRVMGMVVDVVSDVIKQKQEHISRRRNSVRAWIADIYRDRAPWTSAWAFRWTSRS